MAELTSGTVEGSSFGDIWIGTLALPNDVDDGDTVNLGSSNFLGSKIVEILYADGVRNHAQSGSVDVSPIGFSTGTAKITIGNSGTQDETDIDSGRSALSNYDRRIFIVAKSQQ